TPILWPTQRANRSSPWRGAVDRVKHKAVQAARSAIPVQVSMVDPVAQLNLLPEEMAEAQRAEVVRQAEEAQLADAAKRVEVA
ncbi:hypothetical protein HAX54_032060, partial [Datura stramonium]|nr:hypothetical protein [Datura stramonium]